MSSIADNARVLPPFSPTTDRPDWEKRLGALHRQLYASEPFDFDEVMTLVHRPPPGFVLADHCLVHDGEKWHLFYVTGPIAYADEWIAAVRSGDFRRARQIPYEAGDGHAVGSCLNSLRFEGLILDEPQGEFGIALQGTSNIHRFGDGWVNIYTARGPNGQSLCLARSADLFRWEMDPGNPIWTPPPYAAPRGVCKNAHIIRHPDGTRYLIFYCITHAEGTSCVALLTTEDFKQFEDHGPVIKMPSQLRGTQGVESPCVIYREGIWHLFFGCGVGCWHSVSDRPDGFMGGGQHVQVASVGGAYSLGPFHAVEVFEHRNRWYLTSTRKEQQRLENRRARILKFRGSAADEAATLHGLFLCELKWDGDQPILARLADGDVP